MKLASRRPLVAAALAVAMLGALAVPVGALGVTTTSEPPVTEPPTTTTPPSTDTTPVPSTEPSVDPTTTTTVDPNADPADEPTYQNDDDLVGRGFYASQGAFDASMKQSLPADVSRAQRGKALADRRLGDVQAEVIASQLAVDLVQADLARLEVGQRQAVEAASLAKTRFVNRAVAAYMNGRDTESFALLDAKSPTEFARRTEMMSAVLDSDIATASDYTQKRDALTSELQARLDSAESVTRRLADAQAAVTGATAVVQAAFWQLRSFENGSRMWVPGFVFPVAGPVQFVDSFGYPRLLGTGQQHWHEGCDVMSPMGTPLVAVEDGFVTKVGENSLGGLSLKITGGSGYWYYYAHLSAFAPGLVQGMPIAAGTLVGYVGNTGDAAGGPTHLHFEIHRVADGKVLDSFGMLKSAWQARQDQFQLGGTDPIIPPDPSLHPDPGFPGGFPRFPDGRPIFADPELQPPPVIAVATPPG